MSDGELLCNFKNCRKVLTGTAYITRCSHAFCEDDGVKQIESQQFEKKCPACQSPLIKNYDLVKVTLSPNDQFKSMVLAGLRPDVVMDVATRAIMFWNYQQHQEQLHQTMVSKNLREFVGQIKADSEVKAGYFKSEIQTLKRKLDDLEKELQQKSQKCNDLLEKISQKTREVQKWQMMYESLKRKQLSTELLQHQKNTFPNNTIAVNVGPETMDDLLNRRAKFSPKEYQKPSKNYIAEIHKGRFPKENEAPSNFVFQPRAMNTYISPKVFLENGKNQNSQHQRLYCD